MPYPDPTNREAFEQHSIRVQPQRMSLPAINREISHHTDWLDNVIDELTPVTLRDLAPLIGGGAMFGAGLVALPIPQLSVPVLLGSGGVLLYDGKKHWDRINRNRQIRAAQKRVRRRRKELEAERDRR